MNEFPEITFQIIDVKDNELIIRWALDSKDNQLIEDTKKLFPEGSNIAEQLKSSESEIMNSVSHFQQVWQKYHNKFMTTLAQVLNINWSINYSNIMCYVGIMPTCPINIRDNKFYVYYWLTDDELIDTIAHECCHFLFFLKWCQLHPKYDKKDFDYPSKLWQLSEIVIDPILNKPEFKEVFNHQFKSYNYFYDDPKLMNTIIKIFNENSIEDAINQSYKYLNKDK